MNIPKKLEITEPMKWGNVALEKMEKKINKLIDYLQAKEEATLTPVRCCCTKKHSTGEASKGECANCAKDKPGGFIAATSDLKHCASCGRDLFPNDNFPKDNPPEHEEREKPLTRDFDPYLCLDDYFPKCNGDRSHGIKLSDILKMDLVKEHMNLKYVSKEKIKRVASGTETRFSNKTVSMAIEHLLESLGLGD